MDWKRIKATQVPSGSGTVAWCFFLLACVFSLGLFRIHSLDLWGHLQAGRWILESGAVPHQDLFAAPTEGKPWHYHEWLPGTLFYATWSLGGTYGLQLFKLLLMGGAALGLYMWIRTRAVSPALAATLITLACIGARFRFNLRPHLIAFLLLVLMLWKLEKAAKGHRRSLIWVVLFEWIWANSHGSYVLGLALVGSSFGALVVCEWASKRLPSWRCDIGEVDFSWRPWAATLLAAVAVTLLTPFGLDLWTVPFSIEGMKATHGLITEWRAPNLSDWTSLSGAFAAATVLCGILLSTRRLVPLRHWAMVAIVLFLGQRAIRFHAILALVLSGVLSMWLWELVSQHPLKRRAERVLMAVALLTMIGSSGYEISQNKDFKFGLGINRVLYPVDAADFLDELSVPGNVANPYVWGSFLIWRAWPAHRVLVDGRAELFDPEELVAIVNGATPPQWKEFIERFDLNVALTFTDPLPSEATMLKADRWVLLYWDDLSAVWVRDIPEAQADIAKHRLTIPRPSKLSQGRPWREAECADLARLVESARRNTLAQLWLGRCYFGLGPQHHARAAEAMKRALETQPTSVLWNDYAIVLQALARAEEAAGAFNRSLSLNPDNAEARYNFANLLWSTGKPHEASIHYQRFLEVSQGKWPAADAQARKRLGEAARTHGPR